MEQRILSDKDQYAELDKWLADKKMLVVCGTSFGCYKNVKEVVSSHKNVVYFSNYKPNPTYESVVEGVEVFNRENCDAIMAVGGGSAIDVAKCIKLFCRMDPSENYLRQVIKDDHIPFLAVPTTAGTGSESTRYAVIYYEGEKQSVTSEFCIPDVVLLDPENLTSLSDYQRKSTMMDTLAHSLESMWSIKSTPESMEYGKEALSLFMKYKDGYLNNTSEGNAGMQRAANVAGKAINITQTTAGHAMCYKITSMFGCAHGHAAMMVNRKLFPWLIEHDDQCSDPKGRMQLAIAFKTIAQVLDCKSIMSATRIVEDLYFSLGLLIPSPNEEKIKYLVNSVNVARLTNNPIELSKDDLYVIYKQVFESVDYFANRNNKELTTSSRIVGNE